MPANIAELPHEVGVRFQPASAKETRALGDRPEGFVAGWASTDALDDYGTIFEVGAFSEAIRQRGLRGGRGVKFLIGHDVNKPAGTIDLLEYRGRGLWMEAQFNLEITYVRDFYLAAKMNDGFNFSIRYDKPDWNVKTNSNGDEYVSITRADLLEVSGVAIPANEECTMEFIRGAGNSPATLAEFDKLLIREGLARNRSEARKITQAVKNSSKLFRMVAADELVSGGDQEIKGNRLPVEKIEEIAEKMRAIRSEIGSGSR